MVLSIVFTTYTRNGLKTCNLNKPLYYSKLVLKKDKCSSVENTLVLKFDKAILKKIIELITLIIIINAVNSIISLKWLSSRVFKTFMQFFQIVIEDIRSSRPQMLC